jgi:hypothetical protein
MNDSSIAQAKTASPPEVVVAQNSQPVHEGGEHKVAPSLQSSPPEPPTKVPSIMRDSTVSKPAESGGVGGGASVGGGTAAPVTTAAAAARKQTMEKEVPSNSLKGSFVKDLIPMMIGFGDDDNPSMDTVDFVEDAVVAYSVQVLTSALHLAKQRGRVKASTGKPMGPPTAEDVMTVVRKDSRKVRRVEELLIMQKEIKIIQDMEKTDEEALAQQFS